jgi:hypothetical protein
MSNKEIRLGNAYSKTKVKFVKPISPYAQGDAHTFLVAFAMPNSVTVTWMLYLACWGVTRWGGAGRV